MGLFFCSAALQYKDTPQLSISAKSTYDIWPKRSLQSRAKGQRKETGEEEKNGEACWKMHQPSAGFYNLIYHCPVRKKTPINNLYQSVSHFILCVLIPNSTRKARNKLAVHKRTRHPITWFIQPPVITEVVTQYLIPTWLMPMHQHFTSAAYVADDLISQDHRKN